MNILIILSLLLISTPALAQERFTPEQREARFYYDLGPKEVDVTSYPKAQQENYRIFAKTCSQCHTLARAVNSPLIAREDWRRLIKRIHQKTKVTAGTAMGKEAAKAAIDFLAYDSQVRKVKDKAAFAAKTQELKTLFADVRRERSKVQVEADKKKVRDAGK
jgi:cytochrome c5